MTRRRSLSTPPARIGAANGTADRTLDILQLFTEARPVWSAPEIATRFAMPRSTTYRYLNSLRARSLLADDGERGFHLGPGVFALARAARATTSVVRLAAPHLWTLAETFGAKAGLQSRVGSEIVALDILDGRDVSLARRRSQLLPWPATCASKVLFAFTPRAERESLLGQTEPTLYTDRTLRDVESLARALADIRRLGYAVSDEESEIGAWGVGAPVFSYGEARYCIALAMPKSRINPVTSQALIQAVERAASQLSADLAETEA